METEEVSYEEMERAIIRARDRYRRNIRTKSKNGLITISCRKGLWEVTGGDREVVEGEAMHYYLQYLGDGEYDDLS